jgi:endonuclease-3
MSLFDGLNDPRPTPTASPALLETHRRLCDAYGCPVSYFHDLDPLGELVSSLLSHRTKNADSGRAFKALRAAYADWAAVRDAPTAEVEALIAAVTWPEQKAPRIQAVLREITRRRGGELSLDILAGLSPQAARAWLEALPGVGPKTSAAVLSFSKLRMRALPVDSHHHRVAARLGIIPAGLAVGPAHAVLEAMLPADWSAQAVYDHHEVMMFHGQRCCYYAAPACERCTLLDLCPTGKARVSAARALADRDPRPTNARPPGQAERPPVDAAPPAREGPGKRDRVR